MITPPKLPEVEAWEGWEKRWQLTLIAPPEEAPEGLSFADLKPRPRVNIVISRTSANAATPLDAANEFLAQTATAVPDLATEVPTAEIAFRDGAVGAAIVVSFPVQGVRLIQTHLFRLDDGAMSQIVVTADSDRSEEERQELTDAALGFAP